MKIKLDENMPASLVGILNALGHETDTVVHEGLAGCADPEVFQAARESERFFITQDLDFSDGRLFPPGTHPGLLLVRLSKPSRAHLVDRISSLFRSEKPDEWRGCFVVLTDRKLRIRR